MSYINSVIISISPLEECIEHRLQNRNFDEYPIITQIGDWFVNNAFTKNKMFNVDIPARLQADVWAIGTGVFVIDDFFDFIVNLDWQDPECAQIFIKQEHDDKFVIYLVSELLLKKNDISKKWR